MKKELQEVQGRWQQYGRLLTRKEGNKIKIIYSNNTHNPAEQAVRKDDIQKVCEAIICAMRDGLPKEAHTIEIFDYTLQECKEALRKKNLNLK